MAKFTTLTPGTMTPGTLTPGTLTLTLLLFAAMGRGDVNLDEKECKDDDNCPEGLQCTRAKEGKRKVCGCETGELTANYTCVGDVKGTVIADAADEDYDEDYDDDSTMYEMFAIVPMLSILVVACIVIVMLVWRRRRTRPQNPQNPPAPAVRTTRPERAVVARMGSPVDVNSEEMSSDTSTDSSNTTDVDSTEYINVIVSNRSSTQSLTSESAQPVSVRSAASTVDVRVEMGDRRID